METGISLFKWIAEVPMQRKAKGQPTPAEEESYGRLAFNFYFLYHFITSDSTCWTFLGFLGLFLERILKRLSKSGRMSLVNSSADTSEDGEVETELRSTRIAPAATLMIGTAVLTQLMVLSGVAIIMGVAVVTMCAFIIELLVLTLVATALERGIFSFDDLGTLSEIAATLLFTVTTLMLTAFGARKSSSESPLIDTTTVAALKFS